MGQICMTDANTTQDYFILPGPACLNGTCSRPHHSNHIAKWKVYILVGAVFTIIIWHTNLGTRQLQCRLGSTGVASCQGYLFVTSNANMAGYPTNIMSLMGKYLKSHTFVSPSQSRFYNIFSTFSCSMDFIWRPSWS